VLDSILIDRVRSSKSEKAWVLVCVRSIIEFLLILGLRSHYNYTLSVLDNRLALFYRSKSVFRPQRSAKTRTKTFEKMGAKREVKGSEEEWSRQWIMVEKEKLETTIYHFQLPKSAHAESCCNRI